MREISYSPSLDGLRAFCIIFTLFNHINGVPFYIDGSVGVDVFFPLSGFLITSILLKNDWNDLRGYYVRRFYRIAPVYYLSLAITVTLALVSHYFSIEGSKLDQLKNIIIPSILISRELASAPTLFGQAWTVGIEEKFYMIWPIIFLLLGSNRKRIALLVAIIVVLLNANSSQLLRGYGGIALGCLSSILLFKCGFHIKTSYATILFISAYILCLNSDYWFKNISIAIASAFLIPSLYASNTTISRILSKDIIVFLGKLTFSIYMFHVPIFYFVKLATRHFGVEYWLIVFGIGYFWTILFSWFIYRFFENPLIKYGKRIRL